MLKIKRSKPSKIFWYQFQPADEREEKIFNQMYAKTFFTLVSVLMLSAFLRSATYHSGLFVDSVDQLEKNMGYPLFAIWTSLVVLFSFYQGSRILKTETISYKKRGITLFSYSSFFAFYIPLVIIFTWIITLVIKLF